MNILVTGAGALLGQGILRSINQMDRKMIIHTCDPNWRSGGHWLGQHAHYIPPASDNTYIEKLSEIIKENAIDILFIGTDVELPIIAANKEKLELAFGLKIVVSDKRIIDIANDKWKTSKFLEEKGFPFPYSVLSSDKDGVNMLKEKKAYPYFAKPIDGARSKGIVKVENEEMLKEITSYPNNLVIQEYIPEGEGEFTAGCLVFGGEAVAVVPLKRDLRDGNTFRAYYEKKFDKYNPYIKRIAESLGVEGPCNFQFRIRNEEPVIFEINARFSGTTPLRSFFGFNEVEAVIDYYYENKRVSEPSLLEGEVIRVFSDIFLSKEEALRFKDSKSVINPSGVYYPFKND